jgi:hypothetical protein
MNSLHIEGTSSTPTVAFDAANGRLIIHGRSLSEESLHFYAQVHNWLDEYIATSPDTTVVEIKLDYLNTSDSKAILSLLMRFAELTKQYKSVVIRWFHQHENEEMQYIGEDYRTILSLPVEIIGVETL